jgi:hypothetical protein
VQGYKRFGRIVLGTVVAMLTLSVMVHATQVITTPNAATSSYNLAAGANSAAITPAVVGPPVLVMGTQTTTGEYGVGQVTLVRGPSTEQILEWTGLESPSGGTTGGSGITAGYSSAAGTHIVFLDFDHLVDIRVNSGTSFVVHNGNTITQTGNITMIW